VNHWYAVQTRSRQESLAEENLQRQCYTTYLPKIRVRKCGRERWTKVVEPLFPRYLFIRVDAGQQSLSRVRSTQGVAALVRFGQVLKPVPDEEIEGLRRAENPDAHHYHAGEWPHQPGDEVRILEGPCAGLSGIFQVASGKVRALPLLEMLGRQNSVTVAMDAIA